MHATWLGFYSASTVARRQKLLPGYAGKKIYLKVKELSQSMLAMSTITFELKETCK